MNKILDSIIGAFSNSTEKDSNKGLHRRKVRYANSSQKSFILSENATANLEKILYESTLIETGQIKLLGLESIKSRLGDNWLALLQNIHDSLISITESYISSKDVFFNRSDEEFVIVFASTSDRTAELICAKILKSLTEKFLGSSETKDIVVKTALKKVNGEVFFRSENLGSMLEAVANENSPKNQSMSDDELASEQSEKKIKYNFGFRPIWDVRHEAITTFTVKPYLGSINKSISLPERLRIGYDVLGKFYTKEEKLDLDYTILNHSIDTLKNLDVANFRPILNIPVSYETVFNMDLLMKYTSYCSRITPDIGKYIVFYLVGFPEGIPTVKLNFIVSSLKRYGRAVMLNSTSCELHLEKYKYSDVKVIGVKLSNLTTRREIAWEKLPAFIEKCHQYSIKLAVLDVDTLEDMLLAKTNGVDYFAGLAIGDYKIRCGPMQRLPWKQILNSFQDI
ncbi:MAG: hypothetical protein H6912_01675 [Kordiimonadaceae bacterium]|nr:hypothetical protein [Kordiimonadaceae bacterium]